MNVLLAESAASCCRKRRFSRAEAVVMTVGLAPSEPSTSMGPVFACETQRAVDVRQPTPPNRDYATLTGA
jgi:hypothetical protein